MSSTLILTQSIIDDSDLCLSVNNGLITEKTFSFGSDSTDDNVGTSDDNCLEEKNLMKSLGLPIEFNSSRSSTKRSKTRNKWKTNKSKAKPKISSELNFDDQYVNQLFQKHWSENGQQMVDKTWSEKYNDFQSVYDLNSELNGKQMTEEVMTEANDQLCQQLYQNHSDEEYESEFKRFVDKYYQNDNELNELEILPQILTNCMITEDCIEANESKQQSKEDNTKEDNTTEPKETNSGNTTESVSTSSQFNWSSISKVVVNNGSDGEEPPEERPVVIKRVHEFDSIDLNEEMALKVENKSEDKTEVQFKVMSKRKKKKSKYWHQRYRLFSLFDSGIKLDDESWYSVTPERIAKHIAQRFASINNFIIIDAFCGSGGNTIQFALLSPFIKVIAIDIDEQKVGFAKHNANIYGVDHRIEFICADYMLLAKSGALKADAVFLSPPWGGPNYLEKEKFSLEMMSPNGVDVFNVTNAHISPNIGILLPRNIDTNELSLLAGIGKSVEIEKNLLNSKVKTVTAYFGMLIRSD